jgi:protein farnesyltransferase/geranylgeranyltransferase type-1 subunit alpha
MYERFHFEGVALILFTIHCSWSHRQWICATFFGASGAWDGELEFAAAMIRKDVRNNSAWNHRWFSLTKGGGLSFMVRSGTSVVSDDASAARLIVVSQEVDFALSAILLVSRNESSWSYLRGLLRGHSLSSFPRVLKVCHDFLQIQM